MPNEFSKGDAEKTPVAIGVMGGTFDPVHYGHLRTAQEVKQALTLSQMRLIPCGYPPHRDPPVATSEQRLKMMTLVTTEFPELTVDDSELNESRVSYTQHTISGLSRRFPGARLLLVMGIDAFQHFSSWYQWRKILQLCHIVVLCRPGYQLDKSSVEYQLLKRHQVRNMSQMLKSPGGMMLLKEFTQYPISASDIRKRIAQGKSLQGLMPKELIDWIDTQKLYR